jgi:hypothetical protein
MKIGSKTLAILSIAWMTVALLSACMHQETKGTADPAMLSDKEPIQTPGGLMRLQERPAFPVDDKKRPFAMIDDGAVRAPASGKPVSLQESSPKQ